MRHRATENTENGKTNRKTKAAATELSGPRRSSSHTNNGPHECGHYELGTASAARFVVPRFIGAAFRFRYGKGKGNGG